VKAQKENMAGEKDLQKLLRRMNPILQEGEFVFCTFPEEQASRLELPYLGIFREKEGVTFILEKKVAEKAGVCFPSEWKMITLAVHSAMDAVGFLAAITGRLASAGIAVNVLSAYYHDHLFLSAEQTPRAMEILKSISRTASTFDISRQDPVREET
jgi:uncharacterized protein